MVVDFIKTLSSGVQSVKDLVATIDSNGVDGTISAGNLERTLEEQHRELVAIFNGMNAEMDNLKLYIGDKFHKIQEVINHLPEVLEITLKKRSVGVFITTINNRWNEISLFLKQRVDKDVYHHVMSVHLTYMEQNLDSFRFAISPDKTESLTSNGLFMEIATMHKDERDIMCNGQTSHHNIIHLYQMVILTEIRAFVLQVLALNEKFPAHNSWSPLVNYSLTTLTKQMQEYKHELERALAIEKDPYIKACDSEDQHYHTVSRTKDLIYHPNIGRILKLSPNRRRTLSVPLERTCFTLESSASRCDTIENISMMNYHSRGISVAISQCEQDILAPWDFYDISSDGSTYRTTTDGGDCNVKNIHKTINHVCTSTCRMYEKFILALMQSRMNHNYVVVAVRFQKTQNYIYIQIAEGKLEANGYISGFSWIPLTRKENGEDPFDASLTINEGKTMALDDLKLPSQYVLTGIKFSRQVISEDKAFRIGLHGVKFDYTNGKLDLTDETFVLASNLAGTQYPLVEFRNLDYKHSNSPRKLPSLNGAPVEPNPLSPIGGVGVFYETVLNKPPRLSLRLFTIDYILMANNSGEDPLCFL